MTWTSPPPGGRRFSGADSSWWHMEEPTNQMAITVVLTFDGPIDEDRLHAVLRDRLLRHDRFRQMVVESPLGFGRPQWVEDPGFSLERHLSRIRLHDGGGKAELQRVAGLEMSRPLHPDRPLWRMVYVDGFEGGSALVIRIHHCIADGLALVRVLMTLGDPTDGACGERASPAVLDPATYASPSVTMTAGEAAERDFVRALALGTRAAGSLGRLVGLRPDPRTALRGPLCREKRAAWSRPMSLRRLRAASRAAGATLNDVVVAAVAGGLGRFLAEKGEQLTREVRAVVPVNLRRNGDEEALGNRFGLIFAPLPLGIPNPLERLGAVHATLSRLKRSPQPMVIYGLLELLGRTPRAALDLAVWLLGSKGSLVLTNVPGPRRRIRICDRELLSVVGWVPQSGRLGLGVSILSYADEIRLGVATDAAILPCPDHLVGAIQDAADQILDTVRPPRVAEVVA